MRQSVCDYSELIIEIESARQLGGRLFFCFATTKEKFSDSQLFHPQLKLMNELINHEDSHLHCSPLVLSQSIARSNLSSFPELVLGILGFFLKPRTLILLVIVMISPAEAKPLGNTKKPVPTMPTVNVSGMQIFIDEIMATKNMTTLHHDIYRRSLERWSNPCELPGFIFDEDYLEEVEHADPVQTITRILQLTKSARFPAQKLLHDYGMRIFQDPNYVYYLPPRCKWVPEDDKNNSQQSSGQCLRLPEADRNAAKHMTLKRAIKYFAEKLPYYGIALSRCTLDQVIHGGTFLELIREVEIILTQGVCQLQLSGLSLGVRPSRTVISDAMSKDYKDVQSKSQRDLRDILVLRDYNEFLDVMEDTFQVILERTLSSTPSENVLH